jgi:hypothetical protein
MDDSYTGSKVGVDSKDTRTECDALRSRVWSMSVKKKDVKCIMYYGIRECMSS